MLFVLGLGAQNLNPSVSVTNDYAASAVSFSKLSPVMAVPDSLLKFDYSFDYSVFDSPYHGSYEFSPYSVKMVPSSVNAKSHSFFLNMGAGYTFHPELELYWTPLQTKKLSFGMSLKGNGYNGLYRKIGTDLQVADGSFIASDFQTGFSADLERHGKKNLTRLSAFWDGIYADGLVFADMDKRIGGGYNSLGALFQTRALDASAAKFYYDLSLKYRYSTQALGAVPETEHYLTLDAVVGPPQKGIFRFVMDVNAAYDHSFGNDYFCGSFVPRLKFVAGKFDLSVGVRTGWSKSFFFLPEATASVFLVKDALCIYASLSGNNGIMSYHQLKTENHRYYIGPDATVPGYGIQPGYVAERWVSRLGFRGRIGNHFQYNLYGGYKQKRDAYMYDAGALELGYESFGRVDYNLGFVKALAAWKSERVELSADVNFNFTDIKGKQYVLDLPLFEGKFYCAGNIRKRFYFGTDCSFSANRNSYSPSGDQYSMPGWFDFGLFASWKFRSKLAFWIKGGNLFNADIRKSPLYSERGVNVTAGISLCL